MQLFHGDCVEVLRSIPDASVHLILSDIPYGINADEWDVLHANRNTALMGTSPRQQELGGAFKHRGKPLNGWSKADALIPKEYYDWCGSWASEWLRVLKPGGSALVFAGRRMAPRCVVALEDAGFNFRDMLGWVRPKAVHRAQRLSVVFERRGAVDAAKKWAGWRLGNLMPTFEPILWAFKPYRVTIADNVLEHGVGCYNQNALEKEFGSASNLISCGLEPGEGGLHPHQKPVRLLRALIEMTTLEGQTVLDPFAGSGSTLVAAHSVGRDAIGIERDDRHFATLQRRWNGEKGKEFEQDLYRLAMTLGDDP